MLETRQLNQSDLLRTITASVQTDPGCVRESNEDSGRHIQPNDPETRLSKGTLTIVADGMGGHASGEVASEMAVEIISELYYANNGLEPREALRNAIEIANEEIYGASTTADEYAGMGTTLVTLVVQNDTAFCAHVGDSRLYRFRNGALEMVTIDHSQVMEMVTYGIITMEQARHHDDKNVILRAVGTQPSVDVDVSDEFGVAAGDIFLLCSDGLSDMLEDSEIGAILLAETDMHAAAEKLIEAAKVNGGHDNITAGIVKIAEPNNTHTNEKVRVTREIAIT